MGPWIRVFLVVMVYVTTITINYIDSPWRKIATTKYLQTYLVKTEHLACTRDRGGITNYD
jgi:hypothetical protein